MGKKSTPAPVPVPDPVAIANAQGAANTATAQEQQRLNMVNTTGPDGSVTYGADPNAPGGYTQTTTLSPGQQQLYNSNLNTQIGATDIANRQLGRVDQALGQNVNSPQLQTSAPMAGPITSGIQNAGGIQGDIADAGPIQRGVASGNALQTGYNAGGQIQQQIGPTDFTADRNAITDNVWQQAISRLDPTYGQRQNQLDSRLANQGIGMNSQAYGNAQDIEGRVRNDAYNQALYGAINQGAQEQNTLFGQSLAQGTFANQAQQQGNTQNLQQGQFFNQSALDEFNRAMQQGTFANAAQGQQYDQNANNAAFHNTAQAQQYGQNANDAQFANTAQAQQFSQGLQGAQFGNEAKGQQFQADNYAQNQPINQLSALLGLGQVSMPQGINYSPTAVAPTDTLGAQALSTGVQTNNYNQQLAASTANRTALLGGLAKLGGAAITASDRRLKRDVVKLGVRADGLGVYAYRYLWSPIRHIGVMAQEVLWVKPEAVVRRADGFLAVDYAGL